VELGRPVGDGHVIGFSVCRFSENRRREGRTFVVCVTREHIHTCTLRTCVSLKVKNTLVKDLLMHHRIHHLLPCISLLVGLHKAS
jgi:hypothetical protein